MSRFLPLLLFACGCAGPAPVRVYYFVGVDCPLANAYGPEIARLRADYPRLGHVAVYPLPDAQRGEVEAHARDHGHDAFEHDASLALARRWGATKTPEVVVVRGDRVVYRGRIDDRYPAPGGKRREHPTTRDLRDALDDLAAGRPVRVAHTEAVGCDIDYGGHD